MPFSINVPVSPYSSVELLEAWVVELARLREQHASNPEALSEISLQERLARRWLDEKQGR
jgi:hypothetical protein